MKIGFLLLSLLSIALSVPVQHPLVRQVFLRTASFQLPTVRQGKNFDLCEPGDECDGTRICVGTDAPQDGPPVCEEGALCQCVPVDLPSCPPAICDEGETCARIGNSGNNICFSDMVIAGSNGAIVPVGDGTQPPSTTATAESTTTEASTTAASTTEVTGTTAGNGDSTTAPVTGTEGGGGTDCAED